MKTVQSFPFQVAKPMKKIIYTKQNDTITPELDITMEEITKISKKAIILTANTATIGT